MMNYAKQKTHSINKWAREIYSRPTVISSGNIGFFEVFGA
jgi:hypothetical protein